MIVFQLIIACALLVGILDFIGKLFAIDDDFIDTIEEIKAMLDDED